MNHITRSGPPAATAMPSAPTLMATAMPPAASICAGSTARLPVRAEQERDDDRRREDKTPSTGKTTAAFARITRARSAFIDAIDPAPREQRNRICTRIRLNLFS